MEQATNTFSKGLQLDTHPMVQSNESLSDCLNGTLITMNGNEVILQNDMGNRRVNNAFLPSGYEPVGMKEYGGIIYVAAYNPITNKSQIGSFPSPQKKIDSITDPKLSGEFDFGSFFSDSNKEKDSNLKVNTTITFIKTDSFMVPLTGENSLRAGDKFAIYAAGLSSISSDLTNYNNISDTSENKAKSPKNRKYTLQIGILNSQNEFVDITKTLCRWENIGGKWQPKNYSNNVSEVFKFNDSYFISDTFSNINFFETIEDSKLIKTRQQMAANTYAYKLIGPMYLKASLNHIDNFNYNIYGTYDESNNEATLWIEGYLTYNCPDGAVSFVNNSNENYSTFEEGIPGFSAFDLIGKTPVNDQNIVQEKSTYNPNNNTYSVKIVKKYEKIKPTSGTLYDYVIGVLADKDTSNIYLRGLSVKGQLDLALLGTGKVFMDGWRFYNNVSKKSTLLTFSFNAYPKYNEEFRNLRFEFTDITDPNNKVYYPTKDEGLPLYNGRQTITIDWNNLFKPQKTYKVTAYYNKVNTQTGKITPYTETFNEKRWFLTTELFNEFYQASAGVPDFCDNNVKAFSDKMIVTLKGQEVISDHSARKEVDSWGGMTSTTSDIEFTQKHGYTVSIDSNPELKIVNKELYPDYVYIKENREHDIVVESTSIKSVGNIEVNKNDYDQKFKSLLLKIRGKELQSDSDLEKNFDEKVGLEVSLNNSEDKVWGDISYYDRYLGYSKTGLTDVQNVFNTVESILSEGGPKPNFYGGVQVNFDSRTGPDDGHFIDVYHLKKPGDDETVMYTAGLAFVSLPGDDDRRSECYRVYDHDADDTDIISFKDYSSQIFAYFNSGLKTSGQMFMFMFPSQDIWYSNTTDYSKPRDGGSYARVWWRSSDNEWALINTMINKNETFSDYISKVFGIKDKNGNYKNPLVYCMYDIYLGALSNIYATDKTYIYYDLYSIPLTFSINYKIKDGSNVENILNMLPSIGNLVFSGNKDIDNLNSTLITFNLESSEEFHDVIKTFDISSISNIDMHTGLMFDSKGRKLNPNYLYKVITLSDGKTKQLVRIDNTYIQVDFVNKIDDKNTLTYNRHTLSVPNYRFDHAAKGDDDDTHTILDYNLVNLVQGLT